MMLMLDAFARRDIFLMLLYFGAPPLQLMLAIICYAPLLTLLIDATRRLPA